MDVKTPEPITREEMFLNMITGGGGGGSTASVPWNDVTFIDYDGTVLYSYSLEEAQALTELPPLPEQKGLICQGWNWSLEDIKAQGKVIVGAMYITDDGKTRIYITLHEGRTSPMLGVCVNGTVTVDWGDGTVPDVLTGTSTSTVVYTPNHNYAKPGDYVISLSVDGTMGISPTSGTYQTSALLVCSSEAVGSNYVYAYSVEKIEIGKNVVAINQYAFSCLRSLEYISIPRYNGVINRYAFQYCNSLRHIVIPDGVTALAGKSLSGFPLEDISLPYSLSWKSYSSHFNEVFSSCSKLKHIALSNLTKNIGYQAFYNCSELKEIYIPDSVTKIDNSAFSGCTTLRSVNIPDAVLSIGNNAFSSCEALTSIVIPQGVKTIDGYAFANSYGFRYYDFSAFKSVPTLAATTAFYGIPSDCQMLIPSALYDEWSTATNWATYASYMVAV